MAGMFSECCWTKTGVSVRIWMSTLQLPERESKAFGSIAHVLTCARGGGIGKNTSGEICQITDQDSESGRIKAFINNENEKIPMHLIIGVPCRPHTMVSDTDFQQDRTTSIAPLRSLIATA